jgi:hypothetical protein
MLHLAGPGMLCSNTTGESMPIIVTYELEGGSTADRNRLQSMFERLGWENLGGSAYRYPRLGTGDEHPTEDWLNHVIPALMLFRCFFFQTNKNLKKYTLDVQTSTGLNEQTNLGSKPMTGDQLLAEDKLCTPSQASFGRSNLIEWLNDVVYPY